MTSAVICKLTADQVKSIRAEYRRNVRGHGAESLARKYGVRGTTITRIVNGHTWKRVV